MIQLRAFFRASESMDIAAKIHHRVFNSARLENFDYPVDGILFSKTPEIQPHAG